MKQQIPGPLIIAIVVVVLVSIGFLAWKQMAPASSDEKPVTPVMGNPANPPHTHEEGMKMRGGGH